MFNAAMLTEVFDALENGIESRNTLETSCALISLWSCYRLDVIVPGHPLQLLLGSKCDKTMNLV